MQWSVNREEDVADAVECTTGQRMTADFTICVHVFVLGLCYGGTEKYNIPAYKGRLSGGQI